MTQQNPNTTGTGLTESLLPDWNTDHGSFNFGDLLILLFDGILLMYTGWRSFDLLSGTVPTGWEIMAFIGLLALDIGAVLWSYIWIFNSSTDWQDKIAMVFFVIDMSGVALTSITDSLLYGDGDGVMFTMLEPVAMITIPVIIIANVVAGIVYHFTSDATRSRRNQRKLKGKAEREAQRQQDEELQLYYAQQSLLRRQAELPRKVALARLKIAQDQLEKDAMQALFGTGDVARGTGMQVDSLPDLTELTQQFATLTGTDDDMGDENIPGGKLNPANWDLFGNNADGALAGTGNGSKPRPGESLREESIQQAIDDALRENPGADPAAIEQALRGRMEGLGLNGDVVTNPFMRMPNTTTKRAPKWIFFRTNSPKHLIRTDQDGENVTLITGVPSMLEFAGEPPFFYMAGRPDNAQPKNIVRNTLVPRYGRDGKLSSPFFFMDGEEKAPIEITDWRNTAVLPKGADIWGDDSYQEPDANPTQAGAKS